MVSHVSDAYALLSWKALTTQLMSDNAFMETEVAWSRMKQVGLS